MSSIQIPGGHFDSPIILDKPDTTYVLQGDITFTGTGFIIGADFVNLNLNGYTLTYGAFEPNTVGTRDFFGTRINSVDVVNYAPSREYMPPDDSMAQGVKGGAILTSSSLKRPDTGDYAVCMFPKTDGKLSLELIQTQFEPSDPLKPIGWNISSQWSIDRCQRGYSPVVIINGNYDSMFYTTVKGPTDQSIDIGYARLLRAFDCGVWASPLFDTVGAVTVPKRLQTPEIMAALRKRPKNARIYNGKIEQAHGAAYGGHGVYGFAASNLDISRVDFVIKGMDSSAVMADRSNGLFCGQLTCTSETVAISNRQNVYAMISAKQSTGTVIVRGCGFKNAPQCAVAVSDSPQVSIDACQASGAALVANAYCVMTSNVGSLRVIDCKFDMVNGRGISLDNWNEKSVTTDVSIVNCYIRSSQSPNLEYENPRSQAATALRIRSYVPGGVRNVSSVGNHYWADTFPGSVEYAGAVHITVANDPAASFKTNISFKNDHFVGMVRADYSDSKATYTNNDDQIASAVCISGVRDSGTITFTECELWSNHTLVRIGDPDSFEKHNCGVVFDRCKLMRSKDAGSNWSSPSFATVRAGESGNSCSDIKFIDTTFDSCGPTVEMVGSKPKTVEFYERVMTEKLVTKAEVK